MNTKFFKTTDSEGFYSLYVCNADTPIPTMEEIVKCNNLSPFAVHETVEEISREEFLQLHAMLLDEISDSAFEMEEYSPNDGGLCTWEWWEPLDK